MRTVNAKVGSRTDRETYVLMRFPTQFQARQAKRVMDEVAAAGGFDPRAYCVISFCEQHGVELMLVLPANSDHKAQLDAVIVQCRQKLDLEVQIRVMKRGDYEPHAMLARMARSQSN